MDSPALHSSYDPPADRPEAAPKPPAIDAAIVLVVGADDLAEELRGAGVFEVVVGIGTEPGELQYDVEVLGPGALGRDPGVAVSGAAAIAGERPIVVVAAEGAAELELIAAGAEEVLPPAAIRDPAAVRQAVERAFARARRRRSPPNPARFQALIQNSWDMVTVLDGDGRIAYHSPSVERYLGYRRAERVGRSILDLVHPDDRERVWTTLRQLLVEPTVTLGVSCRLRHVDGAWRTLEARASNLLAHPAIRGIVINSWDTTSRERTEMALREQEIRFRTVAESLAEGLLLADLDGRIIYANPRMAEISGYSPDQLVGRPARELAATDAERVALPDRLVRRAQGLSEHYETQLLRSDGERRWVEVRASPFRDGDGRIVGSLAVIADVDERRRQEDRLKLLESAVEGAWDAVCITDAELDAGVAIVYVNPAFERITGFGLEAARGRSPSSLLGLDGPDGQELARLLDCLRRGVPYAGDLSGTAADGRRLTLQWQVAPIPHSTDRAGYFVAILRDVTEHRLLEERLRQSQKMEAVGRLAGGVAHDFNNLLTAIIGYNDLILTQLSPGDPGRREAEQIARAVDSSVSLTSRLLAFSRRDVLEPQLLDLGAVVRDVAEMLRRLLGEQVELAFELPASLPAVRADAGQVQQVLLNLVINARDAMEGAGRVEIATRVVELGGVPLGDSVPGAATPGRYVALVVRDSGCGMTPEVKARALEPFFTTKESGRGTGLGLAMVYSIARQAGGDVAIESAPGWGTAVTVLVPIAPAEAARPEPAVEAAAGPGRGESILLVEDDEAVRALVARLFQRHGYRVLTAGDGAQAVAVAAAAAPIDLLVTDVVMPDVRGSALARRLVALYPGLRVLYISGYAEAELSPMDGGPAVGFLAKPFRPHELLRKVREVLGEARQEAGQDGQ